MFKTPNVKTGTGAVVNLVAVGVGVKASDAVSAIMPESTAGWKRYALAAIGILGAAAVDTKKPHGEKVQMALIGFAGKPLYDELTDQLKSNVDPQDSTTTTGKIVNALVGHNETFTPADDIMKRLGNSADWSARDFLANSEEDMWQRAGAEEIQFAGV